MQPKKLISAALLCGCTGFAQSPAPVVAPAILTGTDETSSLTYALVTVDGTLIGSATAPTPAPRLTAQCFKDSSGKPRFEMLADYGGMPGVTFHAPWKASKDSLYAPSLPKYQATMEFLGYTKVKPVKRQWEAIEDGPLRYTTPGLQSSNLEPITFYLQYLRALPTLRLTIKDKGTVEFETSKWQAAVHGQPLCSASGL